MKIISIHDYDYNRIIVAQVPEYLIERGAGAEQLHDDEMIAEAIFEALGLSIGNCEYMIVEDTGKSIGIDVAVLNSGRGYGENCRRLDEYGGNFREDALAALDEAKA